MPRHAALAAPARRVGDGILLVAALVNVVVYVGHVRSHFADNDFRLYYAGAQVALAHGWSHLYDRELQQAAVAALHPSGHFWALLTPVPIVWLMVPLTALPYTAAYWAWCCLLAMALVTSFALCAPPVGRPRYWLWAAGLGPALFSLYEGQATILVGLGVVMGWRLCRAGRDAWAGVALSLLLLKPNLALLVPICLLAAGRPVAFLTWAAVSGALAVLGVLNLGLAESLEYLRQISAPQPSGDVVATLYGQLGAGAIGHAGQAAAAALAIWAAWRQRWRGPHASIVIGVVGSFLFASYWHPQDFLPLTQAAAIQLAAAPGPAAVLIAGLIAACTSPLNPQATLGPTAALDVVTILMATAWLGLLALPGPRPALQASAQPEPAA